MPNNSSQTTVRHKVTKARPDPMILKLIRLAFQVGGRLAPHIAGRIAYNLWFTPTRHKTPASEINALKTAEIKYIRLNNQNIATYSWGLSGPTVLLVHGWSGRGTQLGAFVEPLIDAGYRVLSFDMQAHGKSSGKQTNLYEVADTLLALQHHYGSFDSVISHSFGGPCMGVALQRGFITKHMVSISPPSNTRGLIEKFARVLCIPAKAENNLAQRFETAFGTSIWDDVSMVNTVKKLKIPGLLIHDTHDADIPWQESHAIAQAWDKAQFIKTTGLGHRRILRDAAVIESAVNFISDNKENS